MRSPRAWGGQLRYRETLRRHRGNDARSSFSAKGVAARLRTVKRALAPYRQKLLAEARATVRFETPLGKQRQIDFGERRFARVGGRSVRPCAKAPRNLVGRCRPICGHSPRMPKHWW